MPSGFGTDLNVTNARDADYWVVDPVNPDAPRRWWMYTAVGRLADGLSVQSAKSRLSAIADGFAGTFPDVYRSAEEYDITVVSLEDRMVSQARLPLLILSGSVAIVLLIAGLNVANLLLMRTNEVIRDVSVRASLGASKAETLTPFLMETGLLTALGGGLGVLLAYGAVAYVRTVNPGGIPRIDEVHLDPLVLAITGGLMGLTALLVGMVPALRVGAVRPAEVLRSGVRGGSRNRAAARTNRAFVVGQVALALVLAVGAGLLTKSLRNLVGQDLGIRPESVVSMRMDFPSWQFPEMSDVLPIQEAILEAAAEVPSVRTAALAHAEHPLRLNGQWYFAAEGKEDDPAAKQTMVGIRVVSPDYLGTLGTPLLKGRNFDERDRADAPFTVLVNESLARKRFGNEDPIGKRLTMLNTSTKRSFEIIGVFGDVKNQGVREGARETLLLPLENPAFALGWTRHLTLHGRVDGHPEATAQALRSVVADVIPSLTVYDVRALQTVIDDATEIPRFLSVLTSAFALLALFLALLGTYAIVSESVASRTHEIGVRLALGAAPARIRTGVVGEGLRLAVVGLVIGVPASLAAGRALSAVLFGVSPQDHGTLIGLSVAIVALIAVASYVPANRASRIEPVRALQAD
jgi:putative ABC transport system permease protein